MKGWLALTLVVLAVAFLGGKGAAGTDVAKLRPVEVLWVQVVDGEVRLHTDMGDAGRGADVNAAIEDLKQRASGKVFLKTAEYVLLSEEALPENGVVMDYTLYNRLYGTQYTTKNLEEFTPHTVTLSRLRPYADIDSRPIFEKEIEITALSKDKGLRAGQALYQFFADHELLEYALCLPDSETLGAAYESIAAQHLYTGVEGYELATNITKIVSVFEEFFALIVVFVVLVSLLVVFFFANTIVRKNRKSIGIMQALGQRTADALRAFAYQILLVLGISAALTVGTYFWLVRWGNGVLQSTFYRLFGNEMVYDFTLLRAGAGVILIDLAVLLLVAACSVGVEMLLLKRINVIEVIRSTD